MPSLSAVLDRTGMHPADAEWLHLLVGDWQMISDLSFADLALWVPRLGHSGTRWTCARHVRPNTGPLVFDEDMVGRQADSTRRRLLIRCLAERRIVADARADWQEDVPLREEAIPVVRGQSCIAVLTRHTNLAGMRTPSRLESTYRVTADTLLGMVASGHFPQGPAPAGRRRGAPRVGDGVLRLAPEGEITYASPNAVSALHRFGDHGRILGDSLSRIITDGLQDHSVVDESLPLVLTGKAPWWTEVEGEGAVLSLRTMPLFEAGNRVGALVLMRDVSELSRRDREILTKDATIREIHHRVKNNLQTVAALLRLQSRRVSDDMARQALSEAERRVATIALVHETLSRTIDEAVDFDEIVSRAFTSIVEVAGRGAEVTWVFEGGFGRVSAEDANALAMIVTELVHNAIEHGLAGCEEGTVRVRARREVRDEREYLVVDVENDGAGLPEGFRPGRSGLGTRIITALVEDLRGSITWQGITDGGTRVTFDARLRPLTGV